jgi:hypothetical protein
MVCAPEPPWNSGSSLSVSACDFSANTPPVCAQRQYLYFCTSKASKLRSLSVSACDFSANTPPVCAQRRYLYFCTSKASKLSTCPPYSLQRSGGMRALVRGRSCVSIRQHTSAYVSIQRNACACPRTRLRQAVVSVFVLLY